MTSTPLYRARPTDCRTGYLVVDQLDRAVPYSTFRRREPAAELAAELNARAQAEHEERTA